MWNYKKHNNPQVFGYKPEYELDKGAWGDD
jgi:hypothetical protein